MQLNQNVLLIQSLEQINCYQDIEGYEKVDKCAVFGTSLDETVAC